jgi:hypothetical protein
MSKNFCDIVKEKIKNSHYYKFDNIAPEGFILITEKSLERLKNFEDWKEWRNNPKILETWMKDELKYN